MTLNKLYRYCFKTPETLAFHSSCGHAATSANRQAKLNTRTSTPRANVLYRLLPLLQGGCNQTTRPPQQRRANIR